MRTLAIGDIHGTFDALTTLADFARIGPDDVLVTLGDYVDRGPDSRAVLDWLIAWEARGQLVPLRGNHEVMFCAAREDRGVLRDWLSVGGKACMRSYGENGTMGTFADVPSEHWAFLDRRCRRYHETQNHIFVHANVDADVPLEAQDDDTIYWDSIYNAAPHRSGKVIVCGHTTQGSGEPLDLGFAVCIDTYAYGGGWLTCLDVNTGKYWQASQRGDTRTGLVDMKLGAAR